jgi:carbonic anhydrase/acetyltransferase-like protein (isoleucine patch superfamily)
MMKRKRRLLVITSFRGLYPAIDSKVWVDPTARLIGNIEIKAGASIWPGVVLRADDAQIVIGKRSAVLDLSLIESPAGHPVIVGDGALISHKACLHGACVEANALVGIGAIVLDGAIVRSGALVGAGAIVTPGTEVAAGMLVLGQPAKPVRRLTPDESDKIQAQVAELCCKADEYRAMVKTGNHSA